MKDSGNLNNEEISVIKEIARDAWFNVINEAENSKYKEGLWKYIDFNIYEFYNRTIKYTEFTLDDLLNY